MAFGTMDDSGLAAHVSDLLGLAEYGINVLREEKKRANFYGVCELVAQRVLGGLAEMRRQSGITHCRKLSQVCHKGGSRVESLRLRYVRMQD